MVNLDFHTIIEIVFLIKIGLDIVIGINSLLK